MSKKKSILILSMIDYITDDTFEASVFSSKGFDIKQVDDSEERVKYVFERTPAFEKAFQDYLGRRLRVEPFALKSSMDNIYKILYSLRPKK